LGAGAVWRPPPLLRSSQTVVYAPREIKPMLVWVRYVLIPKLSPAVIHPLRF
jgi:hypothetical protein